MAETRKSDYTGDVYGAWTVTGRAPAQNRKRAWHVENGTETRVVLQTDLADLGAQAGAGAAVVVIEPANAFDIVFTGSFFVDDPENLPLDEEDEPTIVPTGSAVLKAGAGECRHGVFVLECGECEPTLGPQGREAISKYPSKFKGSAEIVSSVLAANALFREAEASVALDNDPEVGTYTFTTTDGVLDWSHALEPGEARNEPEELSNPVGLGEFVEDDVTEAALDAAVPPQDELRKAIRVLMGQVHDHRIALQALVADMQVRTDDIAFLMDSVDAVMKQAVQR